MLKKLSVGEQVFTTKFDREQRKITEYIKEDL